MSDLLSSDHFPSESTNEDEQLSERLSAILADDLGHNMFELLGSYQRILADKRRRREWDDIHTRLQTLFMAGTAVPLDGPMLGIPVSIRDSDYCKGIASLVGSERSILARAEWMASAWNFTFADTGLWMGKTFEPVVKNTVAFYTDSDPETIAVYDSDITRVGRNFFREPHSPNLIQGMGLPALTEAWNLQPRPTSEKPTIFNTVLLPENAEKEKVIPYTMTGGVFLADMGESVVPEMNGKTVYQLNYRWPRLNPVYPMTRLVDEVVQIGEGIYLGQLVLAKKHYALLTLNAEEDARQLGEDYAPGHQDSPLRRVIGNHKKGMDYYGYQNNGYFLMMDPRYASEIYAEQAFPQLRPRRGESGFVELGYDQAKDESSQNRGQQNTSAVSEWAEGWAVDNAMRSKFTTLLLEKSPKPDDGDVNEMLQDGESVLQMLQRISRRISAASATDDHLRHFEELNRLFRAGIPPTVKDGLFQRASGRFNRRIDSSTPRTWYGEEDPCLGFDYYHGATLNLHLGLSDTLRSGTAAKVTESSMFPSALADCLEHGDRGPNMLNAVWHSIGKYVFPWAGKSFERINGRRLSMLLDESSALAKRYPERVSELRRHLASSPHYATLLQNQKRGPENGGVYVHHLMNGPWNAGMSQESKAFWEQEASEHWVFGNNLQDERILAADPIFRQLDMNYTEPDPILVESSEQGPSPFARQGYVFLGVSGRESILPMNNGTTKKKVFQFHYRYPMIGGPAPIGLCLDELVEIADGLFLGQLIYATALNVPFHSSVDPAEYKYQLFGYFLLLDDDWQRHRLAIDPETLEGTSLFMPADPNVPHV